MSIDNKLNKIFVIIFKIKNKIKIKKSNVKNTKNWDSINHIRLITLLEEEFDLKVKSASDLTSFIKIKRYILNYHD